MPEETGSFLASRMAGVAGARCRLWETLAVGLEPPAPGWVGTLLEGELTRELSLGMAWMGEDRERLAASLEPIQSFLRQQFSVSAHDLRATLAREHDRLIGAVPLDGAEGGAGADGHSWLACVHEMAALCRDETEAWEAGEIDRAKQLRVREHARLAEPDFDRVSRVCAAIGTRVGAGLYRGLAGLLGTLIADERRLPTRASSARDG